jgi:hypothetical protein
MKVQRALNSLIKHLGGWRPYNDEDNKQEENNEASTASAQSAE